MDYEIFDAHCDTLCKMTDEGADFYENECEVDLKRMSAYKSYTQVMACFVAPEYSKSARRRTRSLIDTYRKRVSDTKNIKTILSIEGGDGIKSVSDLERYYKLGVRMVALTWNKSNHLAGGAHERERARGLTDFGKIIIRRMNELGIFTDVSHLNDKSFYDAAQVTALPLIASHSDSRAVCSHPRNLTDDMFSVITKSGGCVGINLYPVFLNGGRRAVIDDVVRHIEHFMALSGGDAVGIGADFDGVDGCLPDGISGCGDLYKIFDRLLQLNYTDEQVAKISNGNFRRIFKKVGINY